MCVIFANYTAIPSKEHLLAGERRNDDGGGVAWREGKKTKWVKGITGEEIWDLLQKVPLPNLVHFRIATEGGICPELTHPFPLTPKVPLTLKGESENGVLAHNGVLSEWRTYLKEATLRSGIKIPGDKWSDSRAIAWLAANFGEGIFVAIPGIVQGQRVAILDSAGLRIWGDWYDDGKKTGFAQSSQFSTHRIIRGHGGKGGKEDWDDDQVMRDWLSSGRRDYRLRKVPNILGLNAGYFATKCERVLAPINGMGSPAPTKVEGTRGETPKVEVISMVKKEEKEEKGNVLIYSGPELEKVMASLAKDQEKKAFNRMKAIVIPMHGGH